MKEWTEIYEQMRGTFAQRAGFVPSEGCDSAVRLYALAAELQSLLMQADWVLDQSFPQTAQGMYLDYHAETRGITRAAAEKAVGTLRFAAADKVTAACPIEKGTVCMTAEGVRFETTEDAAIAVGSQWVDVPAQAVEAGAGGNVIAGTVTLLSAMPIGVVQCTNPAAFSGGSRRRERRGAARARSWRAISDCRTARTRPITSRRRCAIPVWRRRRRWAAPAASGR
ncbi:MAG: baseplate J/gp47 family protein [Oscillospiraceae bacterium]